MPFPILVNGYLNGLIMKGDLGLGQGRLIGCGMIYTIGHRPSYLTGFQRSGNLKKKGRDGDYPGGSVWKVYGDAESHAIRVGDDHSVFGVLADWDKDTEPSLIGDWHDLLIDAELVILEKGEEDAG